MAIIGIDMDGVIADFTSLAIAKVNELFGFNFTLEDMVEPRIGQFAFDLLNEEQQKFHKNAKGLYKHICPPGFFYEIPPFIGAIDAVRKIAESNKIIFVTKPLEWKYCPEEKHEWLKKYFPNMDYSLMMVDSMELKGLVQVDVLIEDDPRAVESLDYASAILIRQPWNAKLITSREDITVVDSMAEVPSVLQDVIDKRLMR